eukprot:2424252-Amphidinium_carterae.1
MSHKANFKGSPLEHSNFTDSSGGIELKSSAALTCSLGFLACCEPTATAVLLEPALPVCAPTRGLPH